MPLGYSVISGIKYCLCSAVLRFLQITVYLSITSLSFSYFVFCSDKDFCNVTMSSLLTKDSTNVIVHILSAPTRISLKLPCSLSSSRTLRKLLYTLCSNQELSKVIIYSLLSQDSTKVIIYSYCIRDPGAEVGSLLREI